jgi:4-carboxymuconolactone decarboxylase
MGGTSNGSALKDTDPELTEVFDNFAFDEVLRHSGLDTRTRLMVQLAALIGCQALGEYRVMLGAALTAGVTPVEVREIVYQAVPYAGMGKAFDFIHATNDVLREHGVRLPLDGQATTTPDTRAAQGRAVQERIVGGDRVERMYASAAEDELHFQRFLSANCFGDFLTRDGIGVPVRELVTFAILAALGGCDPQVRSHVAANLNVGNDRPTLIGVITVLLPFIGYPRTLNALAAVNEIAPASDRETTLQVGAHGDLAQLRQLDRGHDGGGPHPEPGEPQAVGRGTPEQHRQRDRRGDVDGQVAEDDHGNGGHRDTREGAEHRAERVCAVSLSLLRQRAAGSLLQGIGQGDTEEVGHRQGRAEPGQADRGGYAPLPRVFDQSREDEGHPSDERYRDHAVHNVLPGEIRTQLPASA